MHHENAQARHKNIPAPYRYYYNDSNGKNTLTLKHNLLIITKYIRRILQEYGSWKSDLNA